MSSTKEMILNQFYKLNCIKDYKVLEEYVDFCLEYDNKETIKGKTANHHILPMSKNLPFYKFSKLNKNPWNKSVLFHKDHYYAHYLLYKAIDHYSIIYSFCAMHNKDLKLNKIKEEDCIDLEEYQKIFEERNKKISKANKQIVKFEGIEMTKAKMSSIIRLRNEDISYKIRRSERMSGDNNPAKKPEVVEKIRFTKINNKLDKISAERAAITMKKIFIDENGNHTTIYEQNGKKISAHLNQEIILKDGSITTVAKLKARKKGDNAILNGKFYKVLNVFDTEYLQILPAIKVREISPGLEKKTKDNFLGKTKFGITTLTKKNKKHLIGLYVEELK